MGEHEGFHIALAGNPNVGKTSIFNKLTNMNQHTGNWSGKTVDCISGKYRYNNKVFEVIDLPGMYSLLPKSQEEQLACDYLSSGKYDSIVVVIDATNLLRNITFVIQMLRYTRKIIICLNLIDEANKKGIVIDTDELSLQLGIPVIKTSAVKNFGINQLKSAITDMCYNRIKTYKIESLYKEFDDNEQYQSYIYSKSVEIYKTCIIQENDTEKYAFDKLMNSKLFGIPIMLSILFSLLWITVFGANYVSEVLNWIFATIKLYLISFLDFINTGEIIKSLLINGIYTTISWVVSVMMPPMVIFFPIFELLENSGVLPRIAFNLDGVFNKIGTNGKQALTVAMGIGCNCCGVTGCRIIENENNRNIGIVTNPLIPCNGKLPGLIAIISIFTLNKSINNIITALILLMVIVISVVISLIVSKFMSAYVYKTKNTTFVLEMPPFRKPQIIKSIIYSLKHKAVSVLLRAITVSLPVSIIIWFIVNIKINRIPVINYCVQFLEPIAKIIGLDGVIVLAFILALPANEIVIPIIIMAYKSTTVLTDFTNIVQLRDILMNNGWTIITAICFLVVLLFHSPCSTTLITIYKETKSLKTTLLSVIVPVFIGIIFCLIINLISKIYI